MSDNRNNPNNVETFLNLRADLLISGTHWNQVDPPYTDDQVWNEAMHDTFNLFLRKLRQRKRIEGLMYAYYIGKLIAEAQYPITQWNEFVQSHSIREGHRYRLGCHRAYQIFKRRPEQIYLTRYFSFNVMKRLNQTTYEVLKDIAREQLFPIDNVTQGTS
jgi:hypothetical protein